MMKKIFTLFMLFVMVLIAVPIAVSASSASVSVSESLSSIDISNIPIFIAMIDELTMETVEVRQLSSEETQELLSDPLYQYIIFSFVESLLNMGITNIPYLTMYVPSVNHPDSTPTTATPEIMTRTPNLLSSLRPSRAMADIVRRHSFPTARPTTFFLNILERVHYHVA